MNIGLLVISLINFLAVGLCISTNHFILASVNAFTGIFCLLISIEDD